MTFVGLIPLTLERDLPFLMRNGEYALRVRANLRLRAIGSTSVFLIAVLLGLWMSFPVLLRKRLYARP